MTKRPALVVVVLFGVVASGYLIATWIRRCEPEPVYQGKPWRVWVEGPNRQSLDVWRTAVRYSGSNAIPVLLRMLKKNDPPLARKLMWGLQKLRLAKPSYRTAEFWHQQAIDGFSALGSMATNAVSSLAEIFALSISPSSQRAVAIILGQMGPDAGQAVPSLLPGVTNTSPVVRGCAIWALARIHAEPRVLVPVFVSLLASPDATTRVNAAMGLREFGAEATTAIPALTQCLTNVDARVREYARAALLSIDPLSFSGPRAQGNSQIYDSAQP